MTASNYRPVAVALNSSTWTKVLDPNNNRSALILANPHASIAMDVSLAADGSVPFRLAAGQTIDFEKAPGNTVYAKSASGTPSISAYEAGGKHRG